VKIVSLRWESNSSLQIHSESLYLLGCPYFFKSLLLECAWRVYCTEPTAKKKTKMVPSHHKTNLSNIRPARYDIITSRSIGMENKCISTTEIGLLSANLQPATLPSDIFWLCNEGRTFWIYSNMRFCWVILFNLNIIWADIQLNEESNEKRKVRGLTAEAILHRPADSST
jgi:hypothetical protein